MPLTLSAVAAAIAADDRLFGTAPGGFIWCAPADALRAGWFLGIFQCDVLGPWLGHLAGRLVLEAGGIIPAVIWHVSEADRLRLVGAGLIDAARESF